MKKIIHLLLLSIMITGSVLFTTLVPVIKAGAQTCTLTQPVLFGQSQTAVYCKDNQFAIGVDDPNGTQKYTFTVNAPGGAILKSKGGPLDGNGQNLSVAAFMRSASDAGEYRITTSKEGCANTLQTSFFVYYSLIENLTITAWGSNAVSFRWASCGPKPDVTYEYAVTTTSNPDAGTFPTFFTTDTFATRTGLSGTGPYYIHVRVNTVTHGSNTVFGYFDCSLSEPYPWETNQFNNCAGAATIGSLTPVNSAICPGGSVALTASGSNTSYQWYKDNLLISGTTATLNANAVGQYKARITTAAGCQGQVYGATVKPAIITGGTLHGGGNYCIGGTVRLGITNSSPDQTYTIRKDGADIITVSGIGVAQESAFDPLTPLDTIWYSFQVTDVAQAGTYTVRTNNGGCSPIVFGNAIITVSANNTWNGNVSTDWNNPANWSCGAVPNTNSVVVVPNGVPRMPVVNNNVSCFKLTVNPGATITVNPPNKLTVTGTGP